MWQLLSEYKKGSSLQSIHQSSWPEYDEKYLVEAEVVIVIQVNGKVRDNIQIKNPASPAGREKLKMKNEVERLAGESLNVKKHLEGKTIKNVIYVEGKLINFVLN